MIHDLELMQTPEYRAKLASASTAACACSLPTYAVFGTELDGPRGRIALMRLAAEERISLEDFGQVFTPHINLCLACRSCETACPSGVKYGALVETARVVVEHNRQPGVAEPLPSLAGRQTDDDQPGLLKFIARLVWIYQVNGPAKTGSPPQLPAQNAQKPWKASSPVKIRFISRAAWPQHRSRSAAGLMFFTGCIQEAFLAPVNRGHPAVLQRNGYSFLPPRVRSAAAQPPAPGEWKAPKSWRARTSTPSSPNWMNTKPSFAMRRLRCFAKRISSPAGG